jgi:hypothetical protein
MPLFCVSSQHKVHPLYKLRQQDDGRAGARDSGRVGVEAGDQLEQLGNIDAVGPLADDPAAKILVQGYNTCGSVVGKRGCSIPGANGRGLPSCVVGVALLRRQAEWVVADIELQVGAVQVHGSAVARHEDWVGETSARVVGLHLVTGEALGTKGIEGAEMEFLCVVDDTSSPSLAAGESWDSGCEADDGGGRSDEIS